MLVKIWKKPQLLCLYWPFTCVFNLVKNMSNLTTTISFTQQLKTKVISDKSVYDYLNISQNINTQIGFNFLIITSEKVVAEYACLPMFTVSLVAQ